MRRASRTIPDWYTRDWSPATGRGDLPQMSWTDLDEAMDGLTDPGRRSPAKNLFRTLWRESADLSPMDLLQRLLSTMALAFDSRRSGADDGATVPPPPAGTMPRWTWTDLEVALSYTWSGQPLLIATERHHDLLAHRGEPMTGAETARQILLLVYGLPCPAPGARSAGRAMERPGLKHAA